VPAPGGRLPLLLVALAAVLAAPATALAQTDPPRPERFAEDEPPLVRRVDFTGEPIFDAYDLEYRLQTQPNRRFLGIPGLTWWRWIYRLGEGGALGGRISDALLQSGEAPAVLDTAAVRADVLLLEDLYAQEGYRRARVTARIDTLRTDDGVAERVGVTFDVQPGRPTVIRRLEISGLGGVPEDVWREAGTGSVLRSGPIAVDTPLVVPTSARLSTPLLIEERRRLLELLRTNGYAEAARDSIRAFVFPVPGSEAADSVDVRLAVSHGPRYRFGDVAVRVEGLEEGTGVREETLRFEQDAPGVAGGVARVVIAQEGTLSPALVRRAMQFEPGDWFDQGKVRATKQRLESTGVFSFTSLDPQVTDTTALGAPRVPYRFTLATRPRHSIRFETFALQRTDVLSGPQDELGGGIGATYQNANLLGGGEALRIRSAASIAGDPFGGLSSAQVEGSTSLTTPYLLPPFGYLDRALDLFDARSQFTVSLLTARRDEIGLLLRGRGAARLRLEMRHRPTVASFVDVVDLSVSNPDTLAGFSAFLERVLSAATDPVQRAQLVEDYTRPQVVSALRYTLRSATVDPLRRDDGYSYEGAVEVGGNLPRALDRFVYTPGEIEGTLPPLPFFGRGADGGRIVYQQYVRAALDVRRYYPVRRSATAAWKVAAGFAQPYGGSDVIPFERRFYSGGANSVRGWPLRALGPGRLDLAEADDDATNLLGGDIKVEVSTEWRQTLLRDFLSTDWMVVAFADAGNVWFGPTNPGDSAGRFVAGEALADLGVGSGVGVRLAWDFLVLRFDLATRVRDPVRGTLPDGLTSPRLHFGIGHAF
jgi:outer membrane protein assembly factor BamA